MPLDPQAAAYLDHSFLRMPAVINRAQLAIEVVAQFVRAALAVPVG